MPLAHLPLVVTAGQPPNCKDPADPATIILVREKIGTSLGNFEINSIHHRSTGDGSVQEATKWRMFIYTRQSTGRLFLLSVPQNSEGIKMVGRLITNFFTETTVSTLDTLVQRQMAELLRWHCGGGGFPSAVVVSHM